MPDPKVPDKNPMKKEIESIAKYGKGIIKHTAPYQAGKVASSAGKKAKNLRDGALKKLGF